MKSKLWLTAVFSTLLCTTAWAQNAPAASPAKQYFDQAQQLAREGKYDDALAAFDKGIKLEPYNEAAVMQQNRIFMELNRPDDALKMWDKWIELKPDDPQRWLYKMIAAGETDRGDQALKAADMLTQLQPDKVTGWKAKGQCLAGMNRNKEALQAVDRAITLDPMDDDSWRIRLAAESNLKEFDSSIDFCSKIFAQHPKCIVAVYDRAGLYAMKGDKAHALTDLKSALAIRSDAGTRAFARQDERFKSLRSETEFQKLVVTTWERTAPNVTLKVVKVDSAETVGEDGKGANAVDGNPDTFWHTQWKDAQPPPPHEIVIELKPPSKVKGLVYLPRQDGQENGMIKDYEIFVSNDDQDFGQPVKEGAFERGSGAKTATFDPRPCRFIKLKALSEINGQPYTSAAEIDVITD